MPARRSPPASADKRHALRAVFLRISLAPSALVLSFLVADAIYLRACYGPVALYLENHAIYHHRLIPNASTVAWLPGGYYTLVTANSLGLRGPEIESPKPARRFRIVMLGDSFTMGKGVDEHEAFSALVAARLRHPELLADLPDRDYEVVNAGIDSFSPLLEYLFLREEWNRLDPDMVVLNFDMSDLLQDRYYRKLSFAGDRGELRGVSTAAVQSLDMSGYDGIGRWLNRNTYFSGMLYRKLLPPGQWKVAYMATPELLRHTLLESERDFPEEWRFTLRNLHRISKMCASQGVGFLLTVYPWAHQVSPHESARAMREFLEPGLRVGERTQRTLRDFAERSRIPFLDATPEFRRYPGDRALYYDLDPHWTAAGHEVMATALAPFVTREIRAQLAEANPLASIADAMGRAR